MMIGIGKIKNIGEEMPQETGKSDLRMGKSQLRE